MKFVLCLLLLYLSPLDAMSQHRSISIHSKCRSADDPLENASLPYFTEELCWETKQGILQDLIKHEDRVLAPLITGKVNLVIGKKLHHSQILIIMHYALQFKTMQPNFALEIDEENNSPLHEACRYANFDAIELLLNAGAKIDVLNKAGEKPIDLLLKQGIMVHNIEKYLLIRSLLQKLLKDETNNI